MTRRQDTATFLGALCPNVVNNGVLRADRTIRGSVSGTFPGEILARFFPTPVTAQAHLCRAPLRVRQFP